MGRRVRMIMYGQFSLFSSLSRSHSVHTKRPLKHAGIRCVRALDFTPINKTVVTRPATNLVSEPFQVNSNYIRRRNMILGTLSFRSILM